MSRDLLPHLHQLKTVRSLRVPLPSPCLHHLSSWGWGMGNVGGWGTGWIGQGLHPSMVRLWKQPKISGAMHFGSVSCFVLHSCIILPVAGTLMICNCTHSYCIYEMLWLTIKHGELCLFSLKGTTIHQDDQHTIHFLHAMALYIFTHLMEYHMDKHINTKKQFVSNFNSAAKIDDLAQVCSNSCALAMGLLQSCAKPST